MSESMTIADSAIERIGPMATLPTITARILALVDDPTSTPRDLHDLVKHDPTLAARLLKVVNSPFYGVPGRVASIDLAIGLLGITAVRNIAIAATVKKMHQEGDFGPHFSGQDLWLHSIATAIASKLLCDQLKLSQPDEAFLSGLIHDVGITVEMQAMPDELAALFEELMADGDRPTVDMRELEQRICGTDHTTIGSRLCQLWNFPRVLSDVCRHHHEPLELSPERRQLSCIVAIADRLAAAHGFGFSADLVDLEPDPAVLDAAGIDAEQLSHVSEALPDAYEEARTTF